MEIKFKLNRAGVRELLKSPEMQTLIAEHTEKVREKCGGKSKYYDTESKVGKNRAIGTVAAVSYKARKDNGENNTLLKALN